MPDLVLPIPALTKLTHSCNLGFLFNPLYLYSKGVILLTLGKNDLIRMYELMYTTRVYEEKLYFMFLEGILPASIHQSHGQEACGVGVGYSLRKEDMLFTSHRNISHLLTKGLDLKALMAEQFFKETGCSKGRGGTIHINDMSVGIPVTHGILGAAAVHACGAATAFQIKKSENIAVAVFGDGASNEGATYEALNWAQVRKLPVVFVCENNFYGASTHVSKVNPVEHIAEKAKGFNMEYYTLDGNDVFAVYNATKKAVDKARAGNGPTFLELETYRIAGHSRSDSNSYRDKEESDYWISDERDPIKRMERHLLKEAILTPEGLDKKQAEIEEKIEEAVRFAISSPDPSIEDATLYNYYERVNK